MLKLWKKVRKTKTQNFCIAQPLSVQYLVVIDEQSSVV